jgi:hypothetical protein
MLDRIVVGDVPKKHHIQLRGPGGALRYEECLTRDGFDGPYTIAYHERRPHTATPTATSRGFTLPSSATVEPGALLRRHYRAPQMQRHGGAAIDGRVPLLYTDDVVVGVVFPDREDPVSFSNGDADDLFFIHEGGGVLRAVLGDVRFDANDYVCVPRGTLHRALLSLKRERGCSQCPIARVNQAVHEASARCGCQVGGHRGRIGLNHARLDELLQQRPCASLWESVVLLEGEVGLGDYEIGHEYSLADFHGPFKSALGCLCQCRRKSHQQPDHYGRVKTDHSQPTLSRSRGGCRATGATFLLRSRAPHPARTNPAAAVGVPKPSHRE